MSRYTLLFTIFLLTLSTLFVVVSPISAQTTKESEILYREQINAYRDAERTFAVTKEQYNKLGTLASLEQAVSGTRNALLARSKVLITYLEMVRADLEAQYGISLPEKEAALGLLDTQLAYLKTHQDQLLLATDRDLLRASAVDFSTQKTFIEDATYRARILIAMGKIQTVNDKAATLLADIRTEQAKEPVSSLVQSKRERAYVEIEKHIDETKILLATFMEEGYKKEQREVNQSSFNQLNSKLREPYVTAQKTLGFLSELLTL